MDKMCRTGRQDEVRDEDDWKGCCCLVDRWDQRDPVGAGPRSRPPAPPTLSPWSASGCCRPTGCSLDRGGPGSFRFAAHAVVRSRAWSLVQKDRSPARPFVILAC